MLTSDNIIFHKHPFLNIVSTINKCPFQTFHIYIWSLGIPILGSKMLGEYRE